MSLDWREVCVRILLEVTAGVMPRRTCSEFPRPILLAVDGAEVEHVVRCVGRVHVVDTEIVVPGSSVVIVPVVAVPVGGVVELGDLGGEAGSSSILATHPGHHGCNNKRTVLHFS